MEVYDYISDDDYRKANSIGISNERVRKRVRDCFWSVESAITKPIGKRGNRSMLYCDGIRKLAKENGIKRTTLYYRITKMGLSPYEAATRKPLSKTECANIAGNNNRKYDKKIYDKAKVNGLSNSAFYWRINHKKLTPYHASIIPKMTTVEVCKCASASNKIWRNDNNYLFQKMSRRLRGNYEINR